MLQSIAEFRCSSSSSCFYSDAAASRCCWHRRHHKLYCILAQYCTRQRRRQTLSLAPIVAHLKNTNSQSSLSALLWLFFQLRNLWAAVLNNQFREFFFIFSRSHLIAFVRLHDVCMTQFNHTQKTTTNQYGLKDTRHKKNNLKPC